MTVPHAERSRTPDSSTYEGAARALLVHGRFSAGPDVVEPETRRTPGYPALIALVYAVSDDPRALIGVQILLSVATVGAVWLLARQLWDRHVALVAGLLLATDPPSLVASQLVLTEVVFTFVLSVGLVAGTKLWLRRGAEARHALLLGTTLAVAALVRPIAYYLAPLAALQALVWPRKRSGPRRWVLAALVTPWIVLVGGWQLRNGLLTGRFEFSRSESRYLLLARGADIVAQRDGINVEEARRRLEDSLWQGPDASRPEAAETYRRHAWTLIRQHPWLFLRTELRWAPKLMLGTGAAGLLWYAAPQARGASPNAPGPAASGIVQALAGLHLLVLYAGLAAGLWQLRNEPAESWPCHTFLLSVVVYFVLLSSGPHAYTRFRVPFVPLLALYAASGIKFILPPPADAPPTRALGCLPPVSAARRGSQRGCS